MRAGGLGQPESGFVAYHVVGKREGRERRSGLASEFGLVEPADPRGVIRWVGGGEGVFGHGDVLSGLVEVAEADAGSGVYGVEHGVEGRADLSLGPSGHAEQLVGFPILAELDALPWPSRRR